MDVINNVNKQQFELEVHGEKAFIEYQMEGDKIRLISTQVPKSLKGQGIGSKLAEETFSLLGGMNLKIIPECDFIKAWVKKHPEKKKQTVNP